MGTTAADQALAEPQGAPSGHGHRGPLRGHLGRPLSRRRSGLLRRALVAWLLASLVVVALVARPSAAAAAAPTPSSTPQSASCVSLAVVVVVDIDAPPASEPPAVLAANRVGDSSLRRLTRVGPAAAPVADRTGENRLQLRRTATGVTVYVNGDPVNLVDPDGHDPHWQDEPSYQAQHPQPAPGQYSPAYDPNAGCASCVNAEIVNHWHPRGVKNEHPPAAYSTPVCDTQRYRQDGCRGIPGPDYHGAHPETLDLPIDKLPGYGDVYGAFFIPTDKACLTGGFWTSLTCSRGDNRDPSPSFDPRRSRLFFDFDFEQGTAHVVINPSCTSNESCTNPLDITQSRILSELHRNLVQVDERGGGAIEFHTQVSISTYPAVITPTIDNTLLIFPRNVNGERRFGAIGSGDQYPSAEIYHRLPGGGVSGASWTAASPWFLEPEAPDRNYRAGPF